MSILDDAVQLFVNAVVGTLQAIPSAGSLVGSGSGSAFDLIEGYPITEFPIAATATEITQLQGATTQYLDVTATPVRLYTLSGTWSFVTYTGTLPNLRRSSICYSPLTGRVFYFNDSLIPTELTYPLRELEWSLHDTPPTNLNSIAYGNGMFVSALWHDSTYRLASSPDGINWTARTTAIATAWSSVTYGNGVFVAVGPNQVMTSPDGITWTSRTPASNATWSSVCYGAGVFVAVASGGTGNRVMTSTNGTTWTLRATLNTSVWYSVTYGDGVFVAVSIAGDHRIMSSLDGGVTWTARTAPSYLYLLKVAYGNGRFVAVSSNVPANNAGFIYSNDGITWTLVPIDITAVNGTQPNWRCITYGNNEFIALGDNSGSDTFCLARSKDGVVWKRFFWDTTTRPTSSIIHESGRYIAVGTNKIAIAFT